MFATDVPIELKADNGATDHFTENTLHNLKKVPTSSINPAIQIIATNGDIVISIYTTNIPINNLPESSTTVHVFSSLASVSLLSIGKYEIPYA